MKKTQKPDTDTDTEPTSVTLRMTRGLLAAIHKAARADDRSVSSWVRRALAKAAGYDPGGPKV